MTSYDILPAVAWRVQAVFATTCLALVATGTWLGCSGVRTETTLSSSFALAVGCPFAFAKAGLWLLQRLGLNVFPAQLDYLWPMAAVQLALGFLATWLAYHALWHRSSWLTRLDGAAVGS